MVRGSLALLRDAGINGLKRTLSEILVCPLSKQPLRICDKTGSLISDEIGVSFPIKDGIPCLVPKDGKILEDNDNDAALKSGLVDDSSSTNMVSKTRSYRIWWDRDQALGKGGRDSKGITSGRDLAYRLEVAGKMNMISAVCYVCNKFCSCIHQSLGDVDLTSKIFDLKAHAHLQT